MLGTSADSKGGISSVVSEYHRAGLFDRWPITYFATYRDGGKLYKLYIALQSLTRFVGLLIWRDVAIVHVHAATRASFWRKSIFILIAFLARRPVILHLHSGLFMRFYEQECGALAKRFVRYILDHSARIIVLSERRRTELSNISKNSHIVRIVNPISFDHTSPSGSVNREPAMLLFLGRFVPAKGIYDLLEAVALLKPRFPDITLVCGGDGDTSGILDRSRKLGISDAVSMPGWITGTEKLKLLSQATLYVLPSYFEGIPMGILEAMAAGLPVVSTTVGGIPETVTDGTEGYLVKPGDVPGLVAAITNLLLDSSLRQKMGAAGMQRVHAEFSTVKVIPQIIDLYRDYGVLPREIVTH